MDVRLDQRLVRRWKIHLVETTLDAKTEDELLAETVVQIEIGGI